MAIANFPGDLGNIIQQGYLEREFQEPLTAFLGFRDVAEKETFPAQIGETITKTRPSRLSVTTPTPINPSTNTPLDDSLNSGAVWNVEQYVLAINQYADRTDDLNIVADKVALASQFLQNAKNLGEQAYRSLDILVRNTILNAYMGGNTRVTATLGAPANTIQVDDIRGFQLTFFNGLLQPTSPSNTQDVQVGDNSYILITATPDLINISSVASLGGISGTLTFNSNVSVADGTLNKPVISAVAPTIIRPNARDTTIDLQAGDILTLADVMSACAVLESNAVPRLLKEDGYFYTCLVDPTSKIQLLKDPEFQLLYRGRGFDTAKPYRNLVLVDGVGVRFVETNIAPQQYGLINTTSNSINVHRPIVCGEGALIEADFVGQRAVLERQYASDISHITEAKGVYMITRKPIDRLAQFVSQAWSFIGGWTAPTDYLTNTNTVPTATSAYYKRAVIIETA